MICRPTNCDSLEFLMMLLLESWLTVGKLLKPLGGNEYSGNCVLCCQVVDEADRMMEEIKHDWLALLESAVYVGRGLVTRTRPGPLTVAQSVYRKRPGHYTLLDTNDCVEP